MEIIDLITQNHCRILQSKTKTEVLLELIEIVDAEGSVKDIDGLKKEIFYREQIMSTGIGQGVGIPHVRFSGVSDPIILVGIKQDGIADYESLDGELVKLVFMILVNEDQHKEYLRILSLLVHRIKDDAFRNLLSSAKNDGEAFRLITGDSK